MKSLGSKKIIISVLLVAIMGVVSFFVLNNYVDKNDVDVSTTNEQTVSDQSTEDAPTESTDKTEQQTVDEQNNTPSAPVPTGTTVTIEYVQQNSNAINVSAYSDHPQAGTCKAVFTKGGNTVTSNQVSSYVNAAGKNICEFPVGVKCVDSGGGNTVCTDPFIKRSEFPTSGDWQVVVTFNLGAVTATSAPKTITII